MARRFGQTKQDEAQLDMTPMLDIVFIMLIFFIVTSVFVKEAGRDVTKPEATTAVLQERVAAFVAIDDGSAVWVNKKEVDLRGLRATLEQIILENPAGGIVIQGDENAKTGVLMQVMEAARYAGAPFTAIAAEKED